MAGECDRRLPRKNPSGGGSPGPINGLMGIRRVLLLAAIWVGYLGAFVVLHDTAVNDMAAAFVLVPAFITIWVLGVRASYAVSAIVVPLHMGLFLLTGHVLGWDAFAGVEGFFGLTTVAVACLAFGFSVDRFETSEFHLEVQDRHVAAVAHELRNPLTGVIGLGETLVEMWDELDAEEARSMAEMIVREARALNGIIADLLDTGRVKRESLAVGVDVFDVATVVEQAFPEVVSSGPVTAWADADRTSQIVRNLIKNAQLHGGAQFEVEVWAADGRAHVEVRDRGKGVPADIEDRLFSPFVTRGGPGSTGLGLWLSRALAEAMQGKLTHERSDGWTRFHLELPLAPELVTPAAKSGDVIAADC